MNEKKPITSLAEFLKWAEQFEDGQYLFRGLPKESWPNQESAYRRLPKYQRDNLELLLEVNKDLINKARLRGHDRKDGNRLSDLELLAELQHFRAATCLIDYTRNALVALWFACKQIDIEDTEENAKSNESTQKNKEPKGKVYAVRIDDPARFKTINSESIGNDLDYFYKLENSGESSLKLYLWEPKFQNNRIVAQNSVFILGAADIKHDETCIVDSSSKESITKQLDKLFGINEASLFPDFDGFARLHSQRNPYVELDAPGYLQRGMDAHLAGNLDDAIDNYTETIKLKPNEAKPYVYRGLAHAKNDDFDDAIRDYTKAIELEPNNAMVYSDRGRAYARNGDLDTAIKDLGKAIELKPYDVGFYISRGRAHARNGDLDTAIKDFDQAIELEPNNAIVYSDRGQAYAGKGEHEKARQDREKATELELASRGES